jgi:hypothetical protein
MCLIFYDCFFFTGNRFHENYTINTMSNIGTLQQMISANAMDKMTEAELLRFLRDLEFEAKTLDVQIADREKSLSHLRNLESVAQCIDDVNQLEELSATDNVNTAKSGSAQFLNRDALYPKLAAGAIIPSIVPYTVPKSTTAGLQIRFDKMPTAAEAAAAGINVCKLSDLSESITRYKEGRCEKQQVDPCIEYMEKCAKSSSFGAVKFTK